MGHAGHSKQPQSFTGATETFTSNSDLKIAINITIQNRNELLDGFTNELRNNYDFGYNVESTLKDMLDDIIELNKKIRFLEDCIFTVNLNKQK